MKILLPLAILAALPLLSAAEKKFELQDGDRVVFVGNSFFERDYKHCFLETLLTARFADRNITFRNLGWSGDNVWGEARAWRRAMDGFKNLEKDITGLQPTVIFVSYGMNESFNGESALPDFVSGLERMLDMLARTGARSFVLISPMRHENLGAPLPDPAEHNRVLKLYVDELKKVADKRAHHFVDLFSAAGEKPETAQVRTENGIHLNAFGQYVSAVETAKQLNASPAVALVEKLNPLKKSEAPLAPLHSAVVAKNELFFHRWRPENDTYIFGPRKHEQGRNAKDIPMFDPLIQEKEKEIATLRTKLN